MLKDGELEIDVFDSFFLFSLLLIGIITTGCNNNIRIRFLFNFSGLGYLFGFKIIVLVITL